MIFIRLRHLAVILLVLLFVVSAMGGRNEKFRYFIAAHSNVCLSFRYKNLTDCCNKNDHMQRIYVSKTAPSTGIYHTRNLKKILCYDDMRGKFKLMKRSTFIKLDKCRHMRHRRQGKKGSRRSPICPFSNKDKEILHNPRGRLRCILHEHLGAGYTYLSVERNDKFLAVRNGKVQKHKNKRGEDKQEPKNISKRFMVANKNNIDNISAHNERCVR
ncbi:uncharacterized protein [Panulirus ornatus]|uniref:uncharacterized protein n=1 Tax=Panulirus ornatus TaxID=150431 RepID=UPI003A88B694